MLTDHFKSQFQVMCQMDSIPDVSLSQMKVIKGEFIEKIITAEAIDNLGNAARLLNSWIDGALEYTILKHEVIVLRLKNNKVHNKIKYISSLWPKKKEFIEGAYKLLLFTKSQRRQINYFLTLLKDRAQADPVLQDFMNFKEAVNRVLKKWYEQRIQEETDRNRKLRDLHDNLTKIKIMREEEALKAQQLRTTQADNDEETDESIQRRAQLEQEMEQLRQQIQETQSSVDETRESIQKKQEGETSQELKVQESVAQLSITSSESQVQEGVAQISITSNTAQEEQKRQEPSLFAQATSQVNGTQEMQVEEEKNDQVANQTQLRETVDTSTSNNQNQSELQQHQNASLFSSQLLSQILSVGTLFTEKALVGDDQEDQDELDDEIYGFNGGMMMTAEEMRKELLENILKRRIFYADRIEKIEKILFAHQLIPKDQIFCSDQQLEAFKLALEGGLLQQLFSELAGEKEEIWFDIYRSISSLSQNEQTEMEKKKQKRIDRIKRKQQKLRDDLRQRRVNEIEQRVTRRLTMERVQRRGRRLSQVFTEENNVSHGQRRRSQTRQQQDQPAQENEPNDVAGPLSTVVVGLAAIRYLLDTAIQAVQQRRQHADAVIEGAQQHVQQDMAIQTEEDSNANINEDQQQNDDANNEQL